mgnify:CR=1 FL=1
MPLNNIPIILASASPRRRELMEQAGFSFTVQSSSAEENTDFTSPGEYAESLAFIKANDIYQSIKNEYENKEFIVIGADTKIGRAHV